jgi:stage III sporulation protein AF
MIDFVKDWVIHIVALVLFIVLVEMLLPTGRMKKYVSLVTGVILIIAIISPIVEVLGKNADITAFQITNSNTLDKLQIEKDSKVLEKAQMKQIVEVYRDKIIQQIEQSAEEVEGVSRARAEVLINEDYASRDFGTIQRAYIEIVPKESSKPVSSAGKESSKLESTAKGESSKEAQSTGQETGSADSSGGESVTENGTIGMEATSVKPVNKIDKVTIGDKADREAIPENIDPKIKKRLEERMSSVFGISSENIVISQAKR